jgi:CheY-like chemotaxis protein
VKALVVEDNQEAAALMQAQLEAKGFVVRLRGVAEAALALVDDYTPDVITLDILLPGMDGWEFWHVSRRHRQWEACRSSWSPWSRTRAGVLVGRCGRPAKARRPRCADQGTRATGSDVTEARGDVTVLVIDDDAKAVELLAGQLRQCDYAVLRAFGGREGIDLARRHRPHLIALDLEMPEVSGFDVVEALKGDPATAQIPIVVVTAKDLTAAERSQLNGHIHEIVGKAEFNHGPIHR